LSIVEDRSVRLPDFTQVYWASPESQARLAPRIRASKKMHRQLELESVRQGLRRCGILLVQMNEVSPLGARVREMGLELLEVSEMAVAEGYSSERLDIGRAATAGMYAVGRSNEAKAVASAYLNEDHPTVAGLLGYPQCCADFFQQVWGEQGLIDTLWPMTLGTQGARLDAPRHADVGFHPHCNMFFKSLGLRRVFHLPCSGLCTATIGVADRLARLALELGSGESVSFLDQFLAQPLEWTAKHGVAIIETEHVAVATKTDFYRQSLSISCEPADRGRASSELAA
jgi:hypothetical protein